MQVKLHYIRSKFDVVIQDKMPHIKVNEKNEKSVKWILRLLTIIGIASSVIAFSTWYHSMLFSIALFFIDQIFEQIIFIHTIMLVQPLPQNWDGNKWTGMIMATNERDLFLGFGFSDKLVGNDFFNTLFAWNENENTNDDNIQLSLVQEDKENYSVYIYPTVQRTFIERNYKVYERSFDKRKNAGKELNVLVAQMCFCKVFPMSPTCAYNCLKGNSQNIYVQLFDTSRVKEADPLTYHNVILGDQRSILFKNILVCSRSKLDKEKNPMEYYFVPKY
ncbi:hypothetical protein [Ruminiclostridium josui]|uniref:hypothetical protein n=1 Tax=Ruminiclostridium josui TaxID=1499 RepID=UPI0012FEA039|nr:hypothetical protein [Ruminiclostridium josui]